MTKANFQEMKKSMIKFPSAIRIHLINISKLSETVALAVEMSELILLISSPVLCFKNKILM